VGGQYHIPAAFKFLAFPLWTSIYYLRKNSQEGWCSGYQISFHDFSLGFVSRCPNTAHTLSIDNFSTSFDAVSAVKINVKVGKVKFLYRHEGM
jgi:hypothetical protein